MIAPKNIKFAFPLHETYASLVSSYTTGLSVGANRFAKECYKTS